MNASTEIPVTVMPAAEAYIAERDKKAAVEQMIAFLRGLRPVLGEIRVELEPAYDSNEPTVIMMVVERHGESEPEDTRRQAWWDWVTTTFLIQEMQRMDVVLVVTRPEAD